MKRLIAIILFLTIRIAFCQSESDWNIIIELVISEYETDTIQVHNKFDNSILMRDLDNIRSSQDAKLYEKFGTDFDIVSPKVFDDTVTVSIEKVKVSYYPTEKMLKKQNKKRLNRYTKRNLVKNKGKQYAHISIPIISYDGEKAIVYGGYYCGGLCGSGGIFFLEKIDGMWHLIEYERRWVA